MHVSFKIHYRNNLFDKKDSYLISCPPSWDDPNYSYGHQLYPSVKYKLSNDLKLSCVLDRCIEILQMCEKSLYYKV